MSWKFKLKVLLPWTLEHDFLDLKIAKASKEFARYTAWKAAKVLDDEGILDDLNGKSLRELMYKYHKDTLTLLLDALDEYIKVKEDKVKVVKRPSKNAPEVSTKYVLELIPILDNVISTLPHCLRTGEKKFAWLTREAKAMWLKFLEATGYKKLRDYIVRWSSLSKLPKDAVILDVGAGMGLSTEALLKHTKAKIIATDPDPDSIDFARDYIRVLGLDTSRVRFIICRGEDLAKYLDDKVNATLMINILHWCDDPVVLLNNVREVTREKVVMAQGIAEMHHKHHLLTFLMGAKLLPTWRDLVTMIKSCGFIIERSVMFPEPILVLKPRG